MKLSNWAVILLMLLLASCAPKTAYKIPKLNEADQARLTCLPWTPTETALAALPDHIFLTDRAGTIVITEAGHRYVRYDRVLERSRMVSIFVVETAKGAYFSCSDNLAWLKDWIEGQQ